MNPVISTLIAGLNDIGRGFCAYAAGVFVQSGMLIVVLLIADLLIRKRVRATLRYWIWMLVFIKLLLPPAFSLPTGIGYWSGDYVSLPQAVGDEAPGAWGEGTVSRPQALAPDPESPTTQPSDPALAGITEPVQSVPIHSEHLAWQAVVFLCWGVGVLVFVALVIQRLLFVRRLIAQAGPAQDGLPDLLDQCRRRVGIRRQIEVKLSPDAFSPAICGLWRSTILLPAAILTELSPDKLRTVLIHELAHVKRADLWVNCLQTVLQIIYFYNPLVWLANAIVRRVREQAVDEMVLVALGAEARSYSNTLIDIAEMAFLRASPALRLIGVAESKKSLEGRIKHMVTRPIPTSARVGVMGLFVIMAMGAVVLPMAAAKTEPTQPRFMANLSNGVTVELVGVCNWPTQEPVCWKPDGSPLDKPLRVTKWSQRPGANHYGFMFKVTGPGDIVTWAMEGAGGPKESRDVVDDQGNRLEGYAGITALTAKALEQTTMRVGFATGPWTTTWTHHGKGMQAEGGDQGGMLWSRAFEDSDGTHIVGSTPWGDDRAKRIVAIDAKDAMHTASRSGFVSMAGIGQMTVTFRNLKRDDVKEFQFQVRPYEWVEFGGVSLKPGHKTAVKVNARAPQAEVQRPEADTSRQPDEAAIRFQSAGSLSKLGKGLFIYANDHSDRLPDTLADVQAYLTDSDMKWLRDNVEYIKGRTVADRPGEVVAFDRVLLERGNGTNVLYLDSHVAFEGPETLERLGIQSLSPEVVNRVKAMSHLKHLALAAIMYANDHNGSLASELAELKPYLGNGLQFTWIIENVEYLGKGVKLNEIASVATEPLACWKTPTTTEGTAVAFLDGHVEFVQEDRLRELGIIHFNMHSFIYPRSPTRR